MFDFDPYFWGAKLKTTEPFPFSINVAFFSVQELMLAAGRYFFSSQIRQIAMETKQLQMQWRHNNTDVA